MAYGDHPQTAINQLVATTLWATIALHAFMLCKT